MPTIIVNGKLRTDAVLNDVVWSLEDTGIGVQLGIDKLDLLVPEVLPVPVPPPASVIWQWGGPWSTADATQHVGGGTTSIVDFAGRLGVLKCMVPKVGSTSPTKANREKHFPGVGEGRTIKVSFDLYVEPLADLPSYRTWLDVETLSVTGNPGWRISDKSGFLSFNDKFAAGRNTPPTAGALPLVYSTWLNIEILTKVSKTAGTSIIRKNGLIVSSYSGPTIGDFLLKRAQIGLASDSTKAEVVAYYDRPLIEVT